MVLLSGLAIADVLLLKNKYQHPYFLFHETYGNLRFGSMTQENLQRRSAVLFGQTDLAMQAATGW